jgi:hypothetical protein
MEELAWLAVISLSAFAIGTGLVTATLSLIHGSTLLRWKAIAHIGAMIIAGLIMWLIMPQRTIEVGTPTWVYLSGILLMSIGSLGACRSMIRFAVDMEDDDRR